MVVACSDEAYSIFTGTHLLPCPPGAGAPLPAPDSAYISDNDSLHLSVYDRFIEITRSHQLSGHFPVLVCLSVCHCIRFVSFAVD